MESTWGAADSTRDSYDAVAAAYADHIGDELAGKPLDRALLQVLAEEAGPGAPTLDLGCGPGHVTAHLAGLGLAPTGIDFAPAMIDVARRRHPGVNFRCASILGLDESEAFAAAVAFYSLIHFDPATLQRALHCIRAALRPRASFLLGFHTGTEVRHVDEMWEVAVDLDFRFLRMEDVLDKLHHAGFSVEATVQRAPYPDVEVDTHRAYVLARAD